MEDAQRQHPRDGGGKPAPRRGGRSGASRTGGGSRAAIRPPGEVVLAQRARSAGTAHPGAVSRDAS